MRADVESRIFACEKLAVGDESRSVCVVACDNFAFFGCYSRRELDDVKKHRVARCARDNKLILESEVALVYDSEFGKLICASRFPESLFARGSARRFYEIKRFVLRRYPAAFCVLNLKVNFEVTCLNCVDICRCGVRKPCKGRADEH